MDSFVNCAPRVIVTVEAGLCYKGKNLVVSQSNVQRVQWMLSLTSARKVAGSDTTNCDPPCFWLNLSRSMTWRGWKLPCKVVLMSTKWQRIARIASIANIRIQWFLSSSAHQTLMSTWRLRIMVAGHYILLCTSYLRALRTMMLWSCCLMLQPLHYASSHVNRYFWSS